LKRRKFLKNGLISLAAATIYPSILKGRDCEPTSSDIEGPYWSQNHPNRTILAGTDEPGTRIFISGSVKYNDCETPIPNTQIDVWHANDEGCYTVFQECQSGNFEQDPFNLRGIMVTDENGNYAFESILPGYYSGRPRHFHYKATTPSGLEHITQCYFQTDPNIDDQWENSHPGLVIPLTETEEGLIGSFDLVLNEINLGLYKDEVTSSLFENFQVETIYPNPFNNSTQIHFKIDKPGNVNISIYDISGKWITNLLNKRINKGKHKLIWKGLDATGEIVSSGSYLIVMKYGKNVTSKKLNYLK
jgi:protocatechuate 3,4-dioxygenase beta subunit